MHTVTTSRNAIYTPALPPGTQYAARKRPQEGSLLSAIIPSNAEFTPTPFPVTQHAPNYPQWERNRYPYLTHRNAIYTANSSHENAIFTYQIPSGTQYVPNHHPKQCKIHQSTTKGNAMCTQPSIKERNIHPTTTPGTQH
ncbi:hypothetical protein DPMN_029667 [Dreissena polymorpha]|uniref:Uncharacterized protein n=1 Tax=Dreissena polymorpha TaxID=45954 RepID=A0A9D4LWU7_DREPO|nr:hypothetical protein DPMN_029667 [Dreissena polymorpha]